MQYFPPPKLTLQGLVAVVTTMILATGCGMIADTERIVVAKLDGKNITRGKLHEIIYDMPDDERPIIRSRQDYLRVLNQYIDKEIKIPLGQDLAAKGELKIDRELAREEFFKSSGDEEDQLRHMWSVPVPKPGEESELMKVYNLSAVDIQAVKDIIEQGTDQILDKLQGDQAVAYLARKAYEAKELVLDEDTLRTEYELSKESFKSFEQLTILGLQFPTSNPESSKEASSVRERLNNGEDFKAIMDEYLQKDIRYGIESVIENNPEAVRFRGFWEEASGAVTGDVLGPTYMPDYNRMRPGDNGQMTQETVPESWIVFRVLEHKPAAVLPFEQAVSYVAPPVAFAAMMEKLREEHGVEVYEDKLPEPRGGDKDIFN